MCFLNSYLLTGECKDELRTQFNWWRQLEMIKKKKKIDRTPSRVICRISGLFNKRSPALGLYTRSY